MAENIEFIYHNDFIFEMINIDKLIQPKPAKNYIPDWHKKMTPYEITNENPNGKKIFIKNFMSNATAKKCTPMLDSICSGYIVPLWCDVLVKQIKDNDGNFYPEISWRVSENIFELHGKSSQEIPPPLGYKNLVVKFLTKFNIKTPNGYSIIINSPFGYNNLPFHAIPAIIDSDKSVIDNNFPCWIKEDFEGIVEKGTPIVQITPFKRMDWKINFKKISYQQHKINEAVGFKSTIVNNYIKNIWSKKEYK